MRLTTYSIERSTRLSLAQVVIVLGPILAQIWAAQFFFKNLALSVTRYHGQLSSCIISEKTNYLIFRKLADGWMDEQINGERDRETYGPEGFLRLQSN